MKDLIKALQESLKREQERQEALRTAIMDNGYGWGFHGQELDKACDEAEDVLRKVLEEFVDARLELILAAARQREERTGQEARQIADSSGMSQGLAWKFVMSGRTPEEERTEQQGWKSKPLRTFYVEINGQLCKAEEVEVVLPPEDDVRC